MWFQFNILSLGQNCHQCIFRQETVCHLPELHEDPWPVDLHVIVQTEDSILLLLALLVASKTIYSLGYWCGKSVVRWFILSIYQGLLISPGRVFQNMNVFGLIVFSLTRVSCVLDTIARKFALFQFMRRSFSVSYISYLSLLVEASTWCSLKS
jgi:hypothetical protein